MNFVLENAVNCSNSSSYKVLHSSFSGFLGVGLFDSDFNFVKSLDEKQATDVRTASTPSNNMHFSVYISSDSLDKDQTYYIMPYARAQTSEHPTRIRTIGGQTDYYNISAQGEVDNDNHHEDENATKTETLVEESFENGRLAEDWHQDNIIGIGKWEILNVLIGDDNSDTPNPAVGHGCLRLKYNSGSVLGNIRTVTRIETPTLYGVADQQYLVNYLFRKHSSDKNTGEVLSVMIDRGCDGNWELLYEQNVANSSTWQSAEIPFRATGIFKLCIEGSLERGSSIFIDEVKVKKIWNTGIQSKMFEDITNECIYTLSGQSYKRPVKGINILRDKQGKVKKVLAK